MRFIRDIIKDKRNAPNAESAAEIEDAFPEPTAPAETAVDLGPDVGAEAGHAADLPDGQEGHGSEASVDAPKDVPSPQNEGMAEPADLPVGFDDDIRHLEEAMEDFEPPVALDGQTQRDPFEKLRETQETDGSSGGTPQRVSALGRVKPKLPMTAAAKPEVDATAQPQPVDALTPLADAMDHGSVEMPSPAAGRGSSRSGRVKTRLLGFSAGAVEQDNPFEKNAKRDGTFPVGWLVVISEKGRGASFALHDGVSTIGRGTDQTVSLNFGDNSISRDNHVSIAFDSEQNKFFVGHSGKTNLVRVNDVPLLSTEELHSKDLIRLGETTLRFIAFCAEDFGWDTQEEQTVRHA